MMMKFNHILTMIIESRETNTIKIVELQGIIEIHVSKIMEKREGSTEGLESWVNLKQYCEIKLR